MFAGIAPRYDRANVVLSLGIDRLWRRRARRLLAPRAGERILDVCCGTGDVALGLRDAVGPRGRIVGADFCAPMLALAATKAGRLAARAPLLFVRADALALPFADGAFDAAVVAFGIRNVDDPVRGLREMARVVRPGGRVVVLEFGRPEAPVLAPLYRWYSRVVIPRVGALVSGDRAPYEYLPRTSAAFPSGAAFTALMREAGLASPRALPLTLGVAFAYRGEVAPGGSSEGRVPCWS